MEIHLDTKKFIDRVHKASQKVFDELEVRSNNYLKEENREFPRQTIRQYGRGITGTIAKSPRDVVDSGALVKSITTKNIRFTYMFIRHIKWNTDYAGDIYFGYDDVPDFPWIYLALKNVNIVELFKKYY